MSEFKVGDIITGKVAGIQGYGAFIALDDKTQGLVHISEIHHGFVKDVHEFLEVGQEVKVKILEINNETNKISLSIRATEEAPAKAKQESKRPQQQQMSSGPDEGFNTLRDKLQEWVDKADK
ncbi:general stress protein 13 [Listeria sp. FSL L7-1582]|uniref:S1 domain-containing post-transcriptional regulator GSP13 n=1 Tax=Listeria portnoyi TaxID=2713504 RepID=UPI00164D2011|nr:S1 domain-containing post-transcriptional regulator GSP13 [Listeria portnoyi]MBC6310888.1 general stress protein 13 [Listeria portnoyi]